jgi:UDP-4-amino-4,6-dideoxy-N-acetyl-beta-L-altrosamine transaminase/dTDP-4-dehydrorhamnose reductase
MQKKILITGGSGLLAVNWAISIREDFLVTLILHQKQISISGVVTDAVSLSSKKECHEIIVKHKPDVVIHTAGLTDIEKCEENFALAKELNVELAKNVSKACKQNGVKLVHISTDHLFEGSKKFVTEDEVTNPLNIYAKTKLQAEEEVVENSKDAIIVRTNFFGWGTTYRQSFSDLIISKLRSNESVELFSDVFFNPILIDELAKKTHHLIDINASGIFNIVSDERISKYQFGVKLALIFNLDRCLIKPISIDDKTNLVKRPKDMSLSNYKYSENTNSSFKSLDEQLRVLKYSENNSTDKHVNLDLIPYGKHFIDDDDIDSVKDVLKNGMLTQGPKVSEFENKIAKYVGSKYAVAVANGTAALHLACIALELGEGDEVITSPITFVATSNSILYVGATTVFIDININTLNIDIDNIEQVIKKSENIRAIFPVHFAGLPCDMSKIKKIASKYSLFVVEDASHALGASYNNGNKVGNCQYSDMTVFSFHPVKGISAGEGGMITTNDRLLYRKLMILRSHGITKGNFEFPGVSLPDNSLINKDEALEFGELKRWYYEMQFLGYNYRITDIQCALAVSQMNKIDLFLEARKMMVKFYDKEFENVPNISTTQVNGRNASSHHIYVVRINFEKIGLSRHQFMKKLAKKGIGSQVHYIPVVSQPYYEKIGYDIQQYPNSKQYYENTLSLPLFYGLTIAQQKLVSSSVIELLQ